MKRKIILLAGLVITAIGTKAQIGYKGQVAASATIGINHVGGMVGDVRIGGYLSEHSVLGVGVMIDFTKYDAAQSDSFGTKQWIGELYYHYALPLNRFVLLPGGGLLFGSEQCDQYSRKGNILPYGSQFVYGLMLEFNAEYILGRHWAISFGPRMIYLIKTEFDNVKMSANAGLKYYF